MSNEKTQLDRFKEAARELGADDDEGRFNEKLKKMARSRAKNKCVRAGPEPTTSGTGV